MKIFVTGGTGFIGSSLIKALVARGHSVRVLVRKKKDLGGIKKLGAKPVLGDLEKIPPRALAGIDLVYHLAAIRADWGYPTGDYEQTNVEGTRKMLEAARGKVGHFVLISSVKAGHPTSDYGLSKQKAEKLALAFSRQYNLPLTIVRPAIVYGPGDDDQGMMPKMIKLIMKRQFLIVGSGENRVHLVFIDDLVQALLLVAHRKGKGKTYTIASSKPTTLNQLSKKLARQLRVDLWPIKIPKPVANLAGFVLEKTLKNEPVVTRNKVKTATADHAYRITKARNELGYRPKTDYPEGIKKTVKWYVEKWSY